MAQRQLYVEAQSCPGVVGPSQSPQACPVKQGDFTQIVVLKKNGANPFDTTLNLITDETIWDTFLALTDTDDPDNPMKTQSFWDSNRVSGEANIVESPLGAKTVPFYADDIIDIMIKDLSSSNENDTIATFRDNAENLQCMFINSKNQIIHSTDAAGEPTFFPIRLATMRGRSKEGGRAGIEMIAGQLHFEEEVLQRWTVTDITFDLLAK